MWSASRAGLKAGAGEPNTASSSFLSRQLATYTSGFLAERGAHDQMRSAVWRCRLSPGDMASYRGTAIRRQARCGLQRGLRRGLRGALLPELRQRGLDEQPRPDELTHCSVRHFR